MRSLRESSDARSAERERLLLLRTLFEHHIRCVNSRLFELELESGSSPSIIRAVPPKISTSGSPGAIAHRSRKRKRGT